MGWAVMDTSARLIRISVVVNVRDASKCTNAHSALGKEAMLTFATLPLTYILDHREPTILIPPTPAKSDRAALEKQED